MNFSELNFTNFEVMDLSGTRRYVTLIYLAFKQRMSKTRQILRRSIQTGGGCSNNIWNVLAQEIYRAQKLTVDQVMSDRTIVIVS